ncbi:TadE/TadG family type IV pilus assembly protein [Pseudomonas sp. GL-RE-26]|uniref:TadE/TadG family type IV pilus assembly protein n=1 Tax=Pseudomonas sp. GL-RE-26 TaxID=2832390 RepID=UPI001CBD816E|nr:TadE/TadG family type IV pilus assembly protein [Pseudomonas sp. GL-RE-26]MBI3906997.1 pilus assembly protein [Pseudomonas fluorescens]
MRLHGFKHPQRQQGLAIVEFTLVLPVLLLLLLAFGEFGRMLYQYNILLQASRDADRFVASQAWNSTLGKVALSTELLEQTKNVAVYGVPIPTDSVVVSGLTPEMVEVAVAEELPDHVRVTITYPFCPVIGGGICTGALPGFFGNQIALSIPLVASTVMRAL